MIHSKGPCASSVREHSIYIVEVAAVVVKTLLVRVVVAVVPVVMNVVVVVVSAINTRGRAGASG